MGMIRESFVIYAEWDEAIRKAPEEIQLECYHALMDYAKTGEMPKNLSWGADMFMTSIQSRVDAIIKKYQASVENGKKGGRPKTQQDPNETQENPTETQKNPDITQENLEEPSPNLHVHVNVHDNNSLSRNINNNSCDACAHEGNVDNLEELRQFWKNHFSEFWKYNATTFERQNLGLEVTDVIINILRQVTSEERLTYKHRKYGYSELFGLFKGLTSEDFGKIVWSLQEAEGIRDREVYILGALLNKANEKKLAEERKHSLPEKER